MEPEVKPQSESVSSGDFSPAMLEDHTSHAEIATSTVVPASAPPAPAGAVASTAASPSAPPVGSTPPVPVSPAAAAPIVAPAVVPPSWTPEQAGAVAPAAAVPAVAPTPSAPATAPAPLQAPGMPPDQAKLRSDTEALIAKEYALTEDEAQQFLIAPDKVVPAMAARMHLRLYEDVIRFLVAQMPTIQMDIHGRQQAATTAETAFYEAFPQLREHKQDVMDAARLYRSQFPQTDMKKAIADIGGYVMYKKGLAAGTNNSPPPPTRPAVPAMGGGAGALPAGGNPSNPNRWGELATQMVEE